MPIPVKRLDEAVRPLGDRIVELLAKDSENAYSLVEIYDTIEHRNASDGLTRAYLFAMDTRRVRSYRQALSGLVAAKRVRHVEVDGQPYYAMAKR